jgi:hypothetical protein
MPPSDFDTDQQPEYKIIFKIVDHIPPSLYERYIATASSIHKGRGDVRITCYHGKDTIDVLTVVKLDD